MPELSAIIPLATSHLDRVDSASEILTILGRCFPGIVVHIVARAVEGASDKATANADLARALGYVSSSTVIFIEDDVHLALSFGEAVCESLARMAADPRLGLVALFSRRNGPPGFREIAAGRFKQSQAVLLTYALAYEWRRQLGLPQAVPDWDIVLRRACEALAVRTEERLPSVAQHRCFPSVFGHKCSDFRAPTFAEGQST
jgi:hypothetical protein